VAVLFTFPVLTLLPVALNWFFMLRTHTGYLFTCVSLLLLYLVYLLVILLWIQVQQPISESDSLTEVSYQEGNGWNRNANHKCNRKGKKVKNMEKCAYSTAYYEWLCVRMTLRIMQ